MMPTPASTPDTDKFDLFAVCLPGLEPWLAEELQALGVDDPETLQGGVGFRGDLTTLYRTNLETGLAAHVLIRVSEFGARSLADLDHRGSRIDWKDWLTPGTPVVVKANCRRSRIYHSGAAAQRIERHVREHLGAATESPDAAQPIVIRVRIQDNRCTISLDSSGEPLHRRGWRLNPGQAPLREDLAHALVRVSGWDGRSTLVDPMMGSGTILIEAAGMARQLAPGRNRRFEIEQLALHDKDLLDNTKRRADERALPNLHCQILGSDRNAKAVASATENAERAGVLPDLELREATLTETFESLTDRYDQGTVVTNPPYGKRLDDASALASLYRALGDAARRLPAGWRLAFAAADRRLAHRTKLELETAFLADSGGLKIRAMRTSSAGRSTPGTEPPSSAP
jgi:putative N6-adenine-specific DNA methylase